MSRENARQLREQLETKFDESDLKVLVFDLGVDTRHLVRATMAEFVLSILEACARQGLTAELLTYGRENRPDLQWPELTDDDLRAWVAKVKPDTSKSISQSAVGSQIAQAAEGGTATVHIGGEAAPAKQPAPEEPPAAEQPLPEPQRSPADDQPSEVVETAAVQQIASGSYIAQAAGQGKALINVFRNLGSPSERQAIQNRSRMLQRVYDFWIEGFLKQSLHRNELIELQLHLEPDAVSYPWLMMVERQVGRQPLPEGTTIGDLFADSEGQLLILGAPGSGKTTVLLELARLLIDQAEDVPEKPIPVVFNLASWSQAQLPLTDWLVEELNARYTVPRQIGRDWIAQDALTLLLDGLDEVDEAVRLNCLREINRFRENHGFMSVVVCSRTDEYEALQEHLNLHLAVVLMPLTLDEINSYMQKLGDPFNETHKLLQQDLSLQELAQTPLMLNIICIAGRGNEAQLEAGESSAAQRYHQLFELYIDRMLNRPRGGESADFSPAQFKHGLAWLADKMQSKRISAFLVEQLQPDWLAEPWQKSWYEVGIKGVLWLLLTGILLITYLAQVNDLAGGIAYSTASALVIAAAWGRFPHRPIPRLGALKFGVVEGVLFGFFYLLSRLNVPELFYLPWSDSSAWRIIASGIPANFFIPALVMMILAGLITTHQVRLVDRVVFDWRLGLIRGLPIGIALGIPFGLWGAGGNPNIWSGLAVIVIAVAILSQTYTSELDERAGRPNQGIYRSRSNVVRMILSVGGIVIAGLGFGFAIAHPNPEVVATGIRYYALVLLCFGLVYGAYLYMRSDRGRWIRLNPVGRIAVAILGVAIIVGVLGYGIIFAGLGDKLRFGLIITVGVAIAFGGLTVIQHFLIRFIAVRGGDMPWNIVSFLNQATDRVLLRRVGGSYLFVHRLLLDHFAQITADTPVDSPALKQTRLSGRRLNLYAIIAVLALAGLALVVREWIETTADENAQQAFQTLQPTIETWRGEGQQVVAEQSAFLEHLEDDSIAIATVYCCAQNYMVESRFYNPYSIYEGQWNYGFLINGPDERYDIYTTSTKGWTVSRCVDNNRGSATCDTVANGRLYGQDRSPTGANKMTLIVNNGTGYLIFNDRLLWQERIDWHPEPVEVSVGTGFVSESEKNGSTTKYDQVDFWTFDE